MSNAPKKPKYQDVNIFTGLGNVAAGMIEYGGHVQINAYIVPHGGAGLFVMFPDDQAEDAKAALAQLVERGPLVPDLNLTSSVPGALAAGSMPKPTVTVGQRHVAWGRPSIRLAGAA